MEQTKNTPTTEPTSTEMDPTKPQAVEFPSGTFTCVVRSIKKKGTTQLQDVLIAELNTDILEAVRKEVNNDTIFWRNMSSQTWNGVWRNASLLSSVSQVDESGEPTQVLDPVRLWSQVVNIFSQEKLNISQEIENIQNQLQPLQALVVEIGAKPEAQRTDAETLKIMGTYEKMIPLFRQLTELRVKQTEQAEIRAKKKAEKAAATAAAKAPATPAA